MATNPNAIAPHYKRAMRMIGRYLDKRKARVVCLAEIEDGYLLHFAAGSLARLEGFSLQEDDLYELGHNEGQGAHARSRWTGLGDIGFRKEHPVLPRSYEEVLRSLGSRLDAQNARHALFAEMIDRVVLEYSIVTFGQPAARRRDFDWALTRRYETYTRREVLELIATERERIQKELATLAERLRLARDDYTVYLEAGRQLQDEGDLKEAVALYRRGLKVAPKNVELLYRLARAKLEEGDHAGALSAARQALDEDPAAARCHDLVGKVYLHLGQLERARAAFDQALMFEGGTRAYRLHLARVDPKAAARPAQTVRRAEPGESDPLATPQQDERPDTNPPWQQHPAAEP
jgi:predicted negative regulator of RcsB-dependent stress response